MADDAAATCMKKTRRFVFFTWELRLLLNRGKAKLCNEMTHRSISLPVSRRRVLRLIAAQDARLSIQRALACLRLPAQPPADLQKALKRSF